MYHEKYIQFTVTITVETRGARDLKNEKMNMETVPRTSDGFIFAIFGREWECG